MSEFFAKIGDKRFGYANSSIVVGTFLFMVVKYSVTLLRQVM